MGADHGSGYVFVLAADVLIICTHPPLAVHFVAAVKLFCLK
jgi:hypothetical protein